MEKYWLTLKSDVFLWITQNKGLIYNSNNCKKLSFTHNKEIRNICQQLLIIDNLYTVELSGENLTQEVKQWIDSIINIDAGYLIPYDQQRKPISLMPILKVQDDKNYYIKKYNEGITGEIIFNLYEITFYINTSEYGSDYWYKQTIFPLKNCQELGVKKLLEFIQNNKQDYNINIVGNIFSYHNFEMLLANIETDSRQYKIYITIQDFISNMQYINKFQWPNNIYFNILIDSTFDFTLIPLQVSHINISITVLLFSEENYITFENKINHESPIWQNSQIIPIWNGENFNFFHSTVFISEMEVNDIYCSKREVFIKQAVNTYDFGKLTVMPDGQVYANVNTRAIGLIDNSIVSLIYKEFTEGKSWLRIRDQKPCVDCIYQWLCPSPSNYEIVIGKYNLCDIIID